MGLDEVQRDWVGGGMVDLGIERGSVGYLGSKGVYGHWMFNRVNLFATGVASFDTDSIPYLRSGLAPVELGKDVGTISTDARKYQLVAPVSRADSPGDIYTLVTSASLDLWTGHLQHTDIVGLLDLSGAVAFEPQVFLHEVRGGIHTKGFGKKAGAGVSGGRMSLPRMSYFGVEGGSRLTFGVEVGVGASKLVFRRNDPEVLSQFPYAYDAWNLYLILGGTDEHEDDRPEGGKPGRAAATPPTWLSGGRPR